MLALPRVGVFTSFWCVATAGADDVEGVCALPFRLDRVAKQVVDRAAVDHVDEST